METVLIKITGKVQGVFFRQGTREKALSLGVTGTVRNLPDGSVEVIATGTKAQVNALRDWCKTGPTRAVVTDLRCSEAPVQEFENFRIIR